MTEDGRAETPERSRRRTRRQLIAGGAGALGAVAVASVARATPAAAANGDPVILGQVNQSTANTFVNNSGPATTFTAAATGGQTALEGVAVDGTGVSGSSDTRTGVYGASASTLAAAAGVFGDITRSSPGPFSAGVRGQNRGTDGNGIGVYGTHAGPGWGVYGTSATGGVGVKGDGFGNGTGVWGTGATGMLGEGTAVGVQGVADAAAGTGVLAENLFGGHALTVNGLAAFSRSGLATVPAHQSSVSEKLRLSAASFVLATIQGNVAGLYVQGVTVTPGSPGTFTIHLSKATPVKTKVAWMVVN
jgi:hypothetical protein